MSEVLQSGHSLKVKISKSIDKISKSADVNVGSKLKTDTGSKTQPPASVEIIPGSGIIESSNILQSDESATENVNVEEDGDEAAKSKNNIPELISYIQMLDKPRKLQAPIDITLDYLKQISEELGLIKLCWPVLTNVSFEDRTNFPESYLKNSNKEKLLLLYAENFRRQFCHQHLDRKPLFLACDNECGMQKMVCTTIRSTTLPYSELDTWQKCARFVGDHLRYEPLEEPTLIIKD